MNLMPPILLFVIGIVAIVIEVFIPAGGIIGFAGFAVLISSIVLSYAKYGMITGTIFFLLSLILLPVIITLAFKIFPHTFIGKIFILKHFQKKEDGFTSHDEENYVILLNREGTAINRLHPIGQALIDNKKIDVTTNGEFIEKDEKIKVVKVEGNRVIVRKKLMKN